MTIPLSLLSTWTSTYSAVVHAVMAECPAKALEKLAEQERLQSTLDVLESAAGTSTRNEQSRKPSTHRKQ